MSFILRFFLSTGPCPTGVELFSCFSPPCGTAMCTNFPDATCRESFCGGCFAHFFDEDGRNVTLGCESQTCLDGSPRVQCLTDPCDGRTCPEVSDARCVSNYCGGCDHSFEDAIGRVVTDQCSRCKLSCLQKYNKYRICSISC